MSVSLNPSTSLGFNRPLTELVKRTLTISNHNSQPVAFKVKTTAPKLYSVRPNAGRIEPGETVGVSVQLQPMKEDPPPHAKCKDKFLVQSTIITPDKENWSLAEIWNRAEDDNQFKVHQQKIKVVYLPPEGQTLEEEPEELPAQPSQQTVASDESRLFETVRQQQPSGVNGHGPIPVLLLGEQAPVPIPELHTPPLVDEPPASPPHAEDSFVVAREEQSRVEERHRHESRGVSEARQPSPGPIVNVNVHTPPSVQPPSPPDRRVASTSSGALNGNVSSLQESDLAAKLAEAHNEIQRLRALLAATPDPAELRRRTSGAEETFASDVDATSDAGTHVETHASSRQDGASPQQVGIIALLVFIITYLFF